MVQRHPDPSGEGKLYLLDSRKKPYASPRFTSITLNSTANSYALTGIHAFGSKRDGTSCRNRREHVSTIFACKFLPVRKTREVRLHHHPQLRSTPATAVKLPWNHRRHAPTNKTSKTIINHLRIPSGRLSVTSKTFCLSVCSLY